MIVELITFGDELLDGRRVDTNTAWLGRRFTALGFPPRYRQTTTDRMDDIVAAFTLALARADVVLTTGGLGPTADDLTFEGLARALGRELAFVPGVFEKIQGMFAARGLACPASNRRQAMLPRGAVELPNAWGTAPGLRVDEGGKAVFCLPGVPMEMKNIFDASIAPWLASRAGPGRRAEKIYTFVGLGESLLEESVDRCRLGELAGGEVRIAYTASFPSVDVTLSALSPSDEGNAELLAESDRRLRAELGRYLATEGGKALEEKVVEDFTAGGRTLALAESFTGGLVAAKLIDVAGSSAVFERGWITYSDRSKIEQLGVGTETLARFGAVSRECAIEMAIGAQRASGADFALATTGIAGPGGATATKPVGLAYIACVGPDLENKTGTYVEEFRFRWDRNRNRLIAVHECLRMLLWALGPR